MRIAFGTDEETPVTAAVREHLAAAGHEVLQFAANEAWPQVGAAVGAAVAAGEADRGVVCCWTGTGVSIAANKIHGVRAALCTDAETARGARRWNDANVLAFGLRLTTETVAKELVDVFLATDPDPEAVEIVARVEFPHGMPSSRGMVERVGPPIYGLSAGWGGHRMVGGGGGGVGSHAANVSLRHRRDESSIEVRTHAGIERRDPWQLLHHWFIRKTGPYVVLPVDLRAEHGARDIRVEGQPVTFILVGDERTWIAMGEVAGRSVMIEATDALLDDVELVQVDTSGTYEEPSWQG